MCRSIFPGGFPRVTIHCVQNLRPGSSQVGVVCTLLRAGAAPTACSSKVRETLGRKGGEVGKCTCKVCSLHLCPLPRVNSEEQTQGRLRGRRVVMCSRKRMAETAPVPHSVWVGLILAWHWHSWPLRGMGRDRRSSDSWITFRKETSPWLASTL